MTVALWVGCAFALGLFTQRIGLPPLIGFLAGGYALGAAGVEGGPVLETVAHLGVLMMLFTVGLKVRLKNVLRPEVWGTALAHQVLVGGAIALGLHVIAGLAWSTAILVGTALGFSSTVLAAKVLEERRELRAFHGRVAIGILIIQDILAVTLLSVYGGHAPSAWAFGVLLLPFARPALDAMLRWAGHGELLALFGMMLAVGMGGAVFELVGLSPELGALLLGTLLADHPRAQELGNALWSLKEVFLVAFFLSIGTSGLPTWDSIGFGLALALLIPVKIAVFGGVLLIFGLRARTGILTSLALASYSEFALVVAHLAVRQDLLEAVWLTHLAMAVAISFLIGAPLGRYAHEIYERLAPRVDRYERGQRHPDDAPLALGRPEVVIFGMGRVGSGAYDRLKSHGARVVGLDSDPGKVEAHLGKGRRVVYADAEDPGLWQRLSLVDVRAVLLAVPDLEAKRFGIRQLRKAGFRGLISATNVFPEEVAAIEAAGCDTTFNYFDEAGVGFAEHTWSALQGEERIDADQPPPP